MQRKTRQSLPQQKNIVSWRFPLQFSYYLYRQSGTKNVGLDTTAIASGRAFPLNRNSSPKRQRGVN